MNSKSEQIILYKKITKNAIELQNQQKMQIKNETGTSSIGRKISEGTPLVIELLPGRFETLRIGAVGCFTPLFQESLIYSFDMPETPPIELTTALKKGFSKIGVDPSKHPILIAFVEMSTTVHQIAIMDLLFNTFNVKSLLFIRSSILMAIAAGCSNCLTLDINGFVSHICSVEDGWTIPWKAGRYDISASDIVMCLKNALEKQKILLNTTKPGDIQILLDLLQNYCYAALDSEQELSRPNLDKSVKLPGGQTVTLGKERFEVVECLFKPSLVDKDLIGLQVGLKNQIKMLKKESSELSKLAIKTLVIGGTYGQLPGIKERLLKEIATKHEDVVNNMNVICPPPNVSFTFIGSILAAMTSDFTKACLTKDDYDACKQKTNVLRDWFETLWWLGMEMPKREKKQK